MYCKPPEERICQYIASPTGTIAVEPFIATKHTCQWCGGTDHFAMLMSKPVDGLTERMWICKKLNCLTFKAPKKIEPCPSIQNNKRTLEWAEFCEIDGIGDLHHDVSFEKVKQNDKKVEYMRQFVQKPKGMIVMQGSPGTGKTYCAMAMCELFTRTRRSCIFTTQKKMAADWLDTFHTTGNYINGIENCELLVIDDFGTAELSKAFLEFFMSVINTRVQWSNRGTVITTNLDDKKFSDFCGEALSDRFKMGQKFEFTGQSRRTKTL